MIPLEVTVGDIETLAEGINLVWALNVIFLIFFMHAGFAMLEAGQVRAKNVANQLTKNMLTWAVGIVVFFIFGMGLSNHVGVALGGGDAGALTMFGAGESAGWVMWLFSAVFAMTAATIVSGAVAGRAKLRAYVTYTFLLAGVIYPVVAAMVWYAPGGTPLLTGLGFHDFAGGMVVHGVGGIAGLAAVWVLGARRDKFTSDGSVNVIPGHSMTFAVLGTLVLAFGWYGFNVGTAASVVSVEGGGAALADFAYVGRVTMATTLGMTMGALGAGFVAWRLTGKVDTLYVANGMLAGLVGVTGTADVITPVGALALGGLAGAQLPFVFRFVEHKIKLDDVCAVFPVHGSAGVLGIVLYPLWSVDGTPIAEGLISGGILAVDAGAFVPQIIGTAVIAAWTIAATVAVWGALKLMGQARVTPDHEEAGLDHAEHGVDTYPEFGEREGPGGAIKTDGGHVIEENPCRGLGSGATTSVTATESDSPGDSTDESDDSEILPDGGIPMSDGGTAMTMVVGYIRPDKLSDVKQSLAENGIESLTVTNVSGRGSQEKTTGQWRGDEYTIDLHQKVKVEVVVTDDEVSGTVDALAAGAKTGDKGDGKIFTLPISDARQIRTGDTGTDAL